MKKVLKSIFGFFAFLLLSGIFGGIGAGVFFFLIKPNIDAKYILRNGIETEAVVLDYASNISTSSSSNDMTEEEGFYDTIIKEDYYHLKLLFFNLEGEEIKYKTFSIYPQDFINENIEIGETVQVMYKGNQAVVKGFVPKYNLMLWLFPVFFGAIAAGFILLMIISYSGMFRDNYILKHGAHVKAKFLEVKYLFNDKFDFVCIILIFNDDNDNPVKVQTRFLYSKAGAEKFAKLEEIPIAYFKNKAVIITDKT